MRINKYLALCGVASRRKSEAFVTEGKVTVNGKIVKDLTTTVNVKKDKVMLEGELVSLPSNYVYYKLNKPKGYVCTLSDDRGRKTIVDLKRAFLDTNGAHQETSVKVDIPCEEDNYFDGTLYIKNDVYIPFKKKVFMIKYLI